MTGIRAASSIAPWPCFIECRGRHRERDARDHPAGDHRRHHRVLPISSTGHLLIAQHWLGSRSELFNVVIQVGAILGVVVVYWQRLLELSLRFRLAENRDYLYKLGAAFAITAVGGFVAKQLGVELPETVAPVAWALIAGGVAILVIERVLADRKPIESVTWNVAAWVGLSQIVAAVFPGTSRSAAAIFAAMLAGLTSRPAAAEFAFLLGIPTMLAAAAYELAKMLGDEAQAARIGARSRWRSSRRPSWLSLP